MRVSRGRPSAGIGWGVAKQRTVLKDAEGISDERETILITGATDGLGGGVAWALAGQGHTLLLDGRSRQRLDAGAWRPSACPRPTWAMWAGVVR